jgi:cytochrome b pre-mRNA-processing protein 3
MRLFFQGLRPEPNAAALYDAVVAEARAPAWYRDAGIPDTLDGRFAVLATLLALTDIRLERGTKAAQAAGPRLAECFIADMDAQMREAGFGDPSLGKQVRMMVGSLASRVDGWRRAVEALDPWDEATKRSLFAQAEPPDEQCARAIEATRLWWQRLQMADDGDLAEGRIG